MQNILSFDIEEWYHLNYASMKQIRDKFSDVRVVAATEILLNTCAKYNAKATFFFLGEVAERYPELVRRAFEEGHEIASHGYGHKLVYQQSRVEFFDDVKKSIDILQNITGNVIKGYRAPSWSISKRTPWAYEILTELGLMYDASLFPYTTFLYGDSHAMLKPFLMCVKGRNLYEIPATVLELFGQRVPFGGGFYFRILPYWATRLATYLTNRAGRSVVFYLHPREIDLAQPRLPLPPRDYFISYVNLSGTLHKLEKLLSLAPTISISHYLDISNTIMTEP